MPRGRPRKHNPSIPAHIDQTKIPAGIYWDTSGTGRWYVRAPDIKVVAGPTAKLSDLHAIAEQRAGGAARGTIADVLDRFHNSLDFKAYSARTKIDYTGYRAAIVAYPVKIGILGQLYVDRLAPPVFRRLFDAIAMGKATERPGDKPVPGYPSKANHWLRYLRRAFGWGIEHDACKTNPCRGVRSVPEVRNHRMPTPLAWRLVQEYARSCSTRKARAKGCLPPYIWAAMELAYQARLRGIEVLTLTDAHVAGEDIQTNRRKGSRDTLVRKGTTTAAAIAALQAYRKLIWERKHREIPIRAEQRSLFVGEDGDPLTRSGFDTAWGRMMRNAIAEGVISVDDRFGLHGLKHRGVTDTKGTTDKKQEASGHKTAAMAHIYDHEMHRVEPADDA